MKSHLLFPVLALIIFAQTTHAAKIRVDNNPGNPGQYTTAQAAHDGATAGDTLYFTGSALSYGNLTATKKLMYIGPGYFLQQNPKTQANIQSAKFGNVTFNAGTAGTLFTGMELGEYNSFNGHIVINDNNIMVKRCGSFQGNSTGYFIRIRSGLANISIIGCFLQETANNGNVSGYGGTDNVLLVDTNCTNILIKGNILIADLSGGGSNTVISCDQSSYIDFGNNFMVGRVYMSNSLVYNNIFGANNDFVTTGVANGYYNNISPSFFGTSNGNMTYGASNVVLLSGSYDGQYQLLPSSPALGAGYPSGSGYDIGAYGGTDPYVLSGIPAVPHIYQFTAPATGSSPNGLPVTIKVKSQN